jgi:hypothetical protein
MHAHAPPLNASAPLAKGRREELTSERGYHACTHTATFTQQEPPGRTHYSREICIQCGRFLRWVPRPANVEGRRLNLARVARLLTCPWLSSWETGFVRSLSRQKKFSPKQEMLLGRIYCHFFGGPAT